MKLIQVQTKTGSKYYKIIDGIKVKIKFIDFFNLLPRYKIDEHVKDFEKGTLTTYFKLKKNK